MSFFKSPVFKISGYEFEKSSTVFFRVGLANGFHVGQIAHSSRLKLVLDQVLGGDDMRCYVIDGSLDALRPGFVKRDTVNGLQNINASGRQADLKD